VSFFDPGSWRSDAYGDRGRGDHVVHEEQRLAVRADLGQGTLACSGCDAPVAPGPRPLLPTDQLRCPFCDHVAPVRDFLSLGEPTRPARVIVRVGLPTPAPRLAFSERHVSAIRGPSHGR
jgi:hypothetical protein